MHVGLQIVSSVVGLTLAECLQNGDRFLVPTLAERGESDFEQRYWLGRGRLGRGKVKHRAMLSL